MNVQRVSDAVQECVTRCCGASYPLTAVAEYVSRLKGDPAWSGYEIDVVELRAHRMLRGIVSESGQSRLASSEK
jgi:hypothetical protein